MKKIKLYYMGNRMKDIYPHATKFQVFRWKLNWYGERVLATLFVVGIGVGIGYAVSEGKRASAHEVSIVDREIIKEIEVVKAPILDRIAKCESGNTHFDKNGQVLMRSNVNKSVDVGRFQINSVWFKKATELGLDITKEEDNRKMAEWIYANRGTEDWYASKACWNK
jgi:hypothetical protein